MLLKATHAGMLDHEFFRHVIHARHELDDEMTALATAGTGRDPVERVFHQYQGNQADTGSQRDCLNAPAAK